MEYDDRDEEMEEELPVPPTYDSLGNSIRPRMSSTAGVGDGEVGSSGGRKVGGGYGRYRECLKNHAVGIGGHALDGCGEFMPAGEDGTLESLKCAACNCHRNFHRREMEGESSSMMAMGIHQQHNNAAASQFSPYNNYRTPPPPGYFHAAQQYHHHRPLALPAADTSGGGGSYSREDQEDMSNPSSSGGGGGSRSGSKKRHRTKFTPEQKEKMLAFAERLGWKIQKHDEGAVQQFCQESLIKRHVLKVWMHNNKHTLEDIWMLEKVRYAIIDGHKLEVVGEI